MIKRRKPLGRPLPPVNEVPAPTDEQLDIINRSFDDLVPEWAGLLDPKPEGTTGTKFYRDEITGVVTRARDGLVITNAIKRQVMDLYTERVRR